jgi:hypothetical protein
MYNSSLSMDKYKIAEIYIRVNIDYNSEKKEKISNRLRQIAFDQLSGFRYNKGLVVAVETEEGSVKIKVIIYGSVILACISDYGSIKEGLSIVINDLIRVSEIIIERGRKEDYYIDNYLIRSEKRTALPGHLMRTLNTIDTFRKDSEQRVGNLNQTQLRTIMQDLSNLIGLLNLDEQKALALSLSDEFIYNLPEPDEEGMQHLYNLYALKPSW